jgi:hypothetical protein
MVCLPDSSPITVCAYMYIGICLSGLYIYVCVYLIHIAYLPQLVFDAHFRLFLM